MTFIMNAKKFQFAYDSVNWKLIMLMTLYVIRLYVHIFLHVFIIEIIHILFEIAPQLLPPPKTQTYTSPLPEKKSSRIKKIQQKF